MPDTAAPRRLSVLFVLNSLAPGGTEKSTILLAGPLREVGIDATIVTLTTASDSLESEAQGAGVPVLKVASASWLGRLRELRALIAQHRPDVVHTALFEADVLGRLAAFKTGVPVVSSFVNTPYDPARLADPNISRWKLRLVREIDSWTGRLFVQQFHAVSEGVRRANARALRLPLDRILVAERGRNVAIEAPLPSAERAALRRSLGVRDEQVMVLNVGRQEHQKAQADLVAAVPALIERLADVVVLIAGREGNGTNALVQAVEDLGAAAGHVRLLGHRTDVPHLLVAADVLAITSSFEGTAGVALEAMASGTPIVSTRLEGLLGVLEHGRNALLVEQGSASDLADAISAIVRDGELRSRLVHHAQDDFRSRFTLDVAAERMAALYSQIITR